MSIDDAVNNPDFQKFIENAGSKKKVDQEYHDMHVQKILTTTYNFWMQSEDSDLETRYRSAALAIDKLTIQITQHATKKFRNNLLSQNHIKQNGPYIETFISAIADVEYSKEVLDPELAVAKNNYSISRIEHSFYFFHAKLFHFPKKAVEKYTDATRLVSNLDDSVILNAKTIDGVVQELTPLPDGVVNISKGVVWTPGMARNKNIFVSALATKLQKTKINKSVAECIYQFAIYELWDLYDEWSQNVTTSQDRDFTTNKKYELAEQILKRPLISDFSYECLRDFASSDAIIGKKYPEPDPGIFISALVNEVPYGKKTFEIETKNYTPNYLGMRSKKDLKIIGNTGNWLGYQMKDATLEVSGNVIGVAGFYQEGGIIRVSGSVRDIGAFRYGGEVFCGHNKRDFYSYDINDVIKLIEKVDKNKLNFSKRVILPELEELDIYRNRRIDLHSELREMFCAEVIQVVGTHNMRIIMNDNMKLFKSMVEQLEGAKRYYKKNEMDKVHASRDYLVKSTASLPLVLLGPLGMLIAGGIVVKKGIDLANKQNELREDAKSEINTFMHQMAQKENEIKWLEEETEKVKKFMRDSGVEYQKVESIEASLMEEISEKNLGLKDRFMSLDAWMNEADDSSVMEHFKKIFTA